jgi:3-methyl-2-oxobutanoate hydroxymethyltransferase
MLGLSFGKQARFVRPYANLRDVMTDAVSRYADDVRNGTYPSQAESYTLPAEAAEELDIEIPTKDLKTEKS